MAGDNQLVYAPLGGAGEIGMNMYLYGIGPENRRRWIIVDCGVSFGDMDSAPGIDLVMPDIAFIAAQSQRVEGIFITHAHEDHIGAIGQMWPQLKAPVFCNRFTAEIAKRKLDEVGIDFAKVRVCDELKPVDAGPFEVTFFPVAHSIPKACALIIRTEVGTLFHTADFKIDETPVEGAPMDQDALRKIGDAGVLALMCDSTNIFNDGVSGSEATIRANLERLIGECKGAVAATTFASNVARLRTLAEAAIANGRSVVVAGRAMSRMIEAARETGAIKNFPPVITEERAGELPASKLFYLLTGSQGEARAAMGRVSTGSHPFVRLKKGDMVIFSSKMIPGNERGILNVYNRLSRLGVRVVDEGEVDVHVSGHAYRDELARMYELLRPQIAIPMHGEHRHLVEHVDWALRWGVKQSLVASNGTIVDISPKGARVAGNIDTGRIYLDGQVHVGALDGVVRARLKMARQGVVAVSAIVDERGVLIADPEVHVEGAPNVAAAWPAPLDDLIAEAVDGAIEAMPRRDRRSDKAIGEMARGAVRKVCGRYWGKRPVTIVMVTRLEDE